MRACVSWVCAGTSDPAFRRWRLAASWLHCWLGSASQLHWGMTSSAAAANVGFKDFILRLPAGSALLAPRIAVLLHYTLELCRRAPAADATTHSRLYASLSCIRSKGRGWLQFRRPERAHLAVHTSYQTTRMFRIFDWSDFSS